MDTRGIVIIGGGPIGLAHAWGIKKLNPNIPVTIFEKYETYQRNHTLVMQPESLKALMEATDTEKDPDLSKLLNDLKVDKHIKTNALEDIFKALAVKNGVKIINREIKPENIDTIFNIHPAWIIGADGTHSVTNEYLFPEGNQVKIPFDYVLQLRFEVKGEEKADRVHPVNFYQQMARHGMIANEYVGAYDPETQSTPITMQMMISEEAFKKLFPKATSKSPIKPLDYELQGYELIPDEIKAFITNYLNHKISKKKNETFDNIRISVNEAPATYVKQPICYFEGIPVSLAGDAALGLSYFKGLNAGLLSTAKFFNTFKPIFKQEICNQKDILPLINHYTKWFVNDFAPKKVKEVEKYSTWNIRAAMVGMQAVRWAKVSMSRADYLEDFEDIFNLLKSQPSFTHARHTAVVFPHRQYPLVKFAQFANVPVGYTREKIKKMFIDYFKPYKSTSHILQDYKQPGAGLVNTLVGLGKTIHGVFQLNPARIADGGMTFARGLLELTTSPLALVIKPITRFSATIIHGVPRIEEMISMRKLAEKGHAMVDHNVETEEEKYAVLAVAMDLHRKFSKGTKQGQPSKIQLAEQVNYQNLKRVMMNPGLNKKAAKEVHAYFSLFAKKNKICKQETNSLLDNANSRNYRTINK